MINEIEVKARIQAAVDQRNEQADRLVIAAGTHALMAARIAELEAKVKELEAAKAATSAPAVPAGRKRRG